MLIELEEGLPWLSLTHFRSSSLLIHGAARWPHLVRVPIFSLPDSFPCSLLTCRYSICTPTNLQNQHTAMMVTNSFCLVYPSRENGRVKWNFILFLIIEHANKYKPTKFTWQKLRCLKNRKIEKICKYGPWSCSFFVLMVVFECGESFLWLRELHKLRKILFKAEQFVGILYTYSQRYFVLFFG